MKSIAPRMLSKRLISFAGCRTEEQSFVVTGLAIHEVININTSTRRAGLVKIESMTSA